MTLMDMIKAHSYLSALPRSSQIAKAIEKLENMICTDILSMQQQTTDLYSNEKD